MQTIISTLDNQNPARFGSEARGADYLEIRISSHTKQRARERGASEEEIRHVVESGFEISAKRHRLGRAMIYPYDQERLGRYYPEKRVEVFYTVEANVMVTVTVYVFYGKWEDERANPIR
jgi:hypothetical protein